jgi:hypothetical protein
MSMWYRHGQGVCPSGEGTREGKGDNKEVTVRGGEGHGQESCHSTVKTSHLAATKETAHAGGEHEITFSSEDDLHEMTRSHLLNGLDTWICTSFKVATSSLVVPYQICNSYIPFVHLQIIEFETWVKEQQEKAEVMMMKSPSQEEKVVDMKAATQQSRAAVSQSHTPPRR